MAELKIFSVQDAERTLPLVRKILADLKIEYDEWREAVAGYEVLAAASRADTGETDDLLFPAGPYRRHVEENAARNYILDPGAIRDGWNEIVLYNESASEVNIVAVELALRTPRA